MNTLQLPRDIEKALQLSWDDMHPLTEKYKSEIAEKLSTIMCVLKKNISCRSKSTLRYLINGKRYYYSVYVDTIDCDRYLERRMAIIAIVFSTSPLR